MKKILFDGNKNVIWEKLRLYREKAGLSQTQLAARMQTLGVNIDQQMISRIEKNERFVTDYELACFCRVFDISLSDMLSEYYSRYM